MPDRFLYIFLDESGNLDFSPSGTRYFILSSVAKERPFNAYKELTELKYDLVEMGIGIEYFHASEDTQAIRNLVFEIIKRNIVGIRLDALVVEKAKTGPSLRAEERFYPEMIGYLLNYILNGFDLKQFTEVIIFTDRIPVLRKRNAVEKAVKMTLASKLPQGIKYCILHHESKSNLDLQVADYCNWAIYRKWDRADVRSYDLIQQVIQSEFEIFKTGVRKYY
jgi:hypothetical protein